jgi:hypothetical protein
MQLGVDLIVNQQRTSTNATTIKLKTYLFNDLLLLAQFVLFRPLGQLSHCIKQFLILFLNFFNIPNDKQKSLTTAMTYLKETRLHVTASWPLRGSLLSDFGSTVFTP